MVVEEAPLLKPSIGEVDESGDDDEEDDGERCSDDDDNEPEVLDPNGDDGSG